MQNFLNGDRVILRWLALECIAPDQWSPLEGLLDHDERQRARRFRFERDRQAYIAAHALLRVMLSRLSAAAVTVAPQDWRFCVNEYGKPELVRAPGVPPLRTNLSHTRGLVAVAVALEHDVGVDVEWLARGRLDMELARRFFAPAECAMLSESPAERVNDDLLAVWTLKEAYIKAVGRGLALGLDAFAIELDPLAISFTSRIDDSPDQWLLQRYRPTTAHALALALRHASPETVTVSAREADLSWVLDHGASPEPSRPLCFPEFSRPLANVEEE